MKSHSLAIAVSLFFTLILTLGAPGLAATGDVPPVLYQITDEHPGFEKRIADIAGVTQELAIEIHAAAIDTVPDALSLILPGERRVTATKQRFTASKDLLTWSGQIDGGGDGASGFVLLIDRGDRISGVVNIGSERYQIVPTESGHRLVRIESETTTCFFKDELEEGAFDAATESMTDSGLSASIQAQPSFEPAPQANGINEANENTPVQTKSLTVIDLLAIYPSSISGAAETAAREFIEDSVILANEIFAMSQLDIRYDLLDMVKLTAADQPPATGLRNAIEWMTPEQQPGQDVDTLGPPEMLGLREEYAADMVTLFVPLGYDDNNYCGIANLPDKDGNIRSYGDGAPTRGEFGKRAFTANRVGCGLGDFTLAHELGHNYGMRHDVGSDDPSDHAFAFGRGHVLTYKPWQENANGNLETDVFGEFAVGYHFTPLVDGFVTGLGGLWNGMKRMRLYEKDTGDLIAQTFVDPQNQWTYRDISPLRVNAGTTYTLAVFINGDGGSIYRDPIPFPQTYNGLLRIEGTTFVSTASNPVERPTNTVTDIMYGQVDIRFDGRATVMGCVRTTGDITGEVCNRIPYFSDPAMTFDGRPIGTVTRDNGRVAEIQAGPYSQFGTNSAPQCQDDFMTTAVDTPLTVPLGALLGNDSDPDGDGVRLADYDQTTAQGGDNDTEHAGGFIYTPPPGFSGTDWFNYTISDRPEGHPAARFDTCRGYIDVGSQEEVIGEVGEVTFLTSAPRTITLSRSYSDPVVIAQTLSEVEAETAVVRITDVRSDRFTFQVHEAQDQDGSHGAEKVAYLVLESGNWRLPSGELLRVGTLLTSRTVGRSIVNQWDTVNFGPVAASIPLLFSQVQTNNDPSWVKTRHRSVSASGAQLGLEKAETNTVSHGLERVGWVAIETGAGSWNGRAFTAARTPNAVRHQPYTLFSNLSLEPPRLFAAMPTYDGADNAALRFGSSGLTGTYIRVEEDTTLDAETTHTTEVVDYLVINGNGQLTGIPE